MRVHVEQYVAQGVRLYGERGLALRRVADRVGLRRELQSLREPLGRLLRLAAEVVGEVGRDYHLVRELLDAALRELLRDERRVEVAEGRVGARDYEAALQHTRLVHRAVDVDLRLEPVVLAESLQRRERRGELDERRGVEGHVRVVFGERRATAAAARLDEHAVARGRS